MQLLPESIAKTTTTALDKTWATRLELLRYELLKVDLLTETNETKLSMWLEMFGVALSDIPDSLTTAEYQRLLRYIIIIFRLSGTKRSIELLSFILGATEVEIVQDFTIYYNSMISYDGQYRYDGGELNRPFVVSLTVTGIPSAEYAAFELKFRQLFRIFEPVWIYLKGIIFKGDSFPLTFPFNLAGSGAFPVTFPVVL
jgi:hypothetical protein